MNQCFKFLFFQFIIFFTNCSTAWTANLESGHPNDAENKFPSFYKESMILFHWGPKDFVGNKLDLGGFDFQNKAHYSELSDGKSSACNIGRWLYANRDRFYQQQGNSGRANIQGFVDGPGLYCSEDFLEYLFGKHNTPEDLLIIEITFPHSKNPLINSPPPNLQPFILAKQFSEQRFDIEKKVPLLAKNSVKNSVVIYRVPFENEEISIEYRPPNSEDIKRIWHMNSQTPKEALNFLTKLAEIQAPGSVQVIPRGLGITTPIVRIVFDRLFFDYGYEYLMDLLGSDNKTDLSYPYLPNIFNAYKRRLPENSEKLIRLKNMISQGSHSSCGNLFKDSE